MEDVFDAGIAVYRVENEPCSRTIFSRPERLGLKL